MSKKTIRTQALALTLCSILIPAYLDAMEQKALALWHSGDTRTALIAAGAGFGGAFVALGVRNIWNSRAAQAQQKKEIELATQAHASELGNGTELQSFQRTDAENSTLAQLKKDMQTLETALTTLKEKTQEESQKNTQEFQSKTTSLVQTLGTLSTGVNARLNSLEKSKTLAQGLQVDLLELRATVNTLKLKLTALYPDTFAVHATPEVQASDEQADDQL